MFRYLLIPFLLIPLIEVWILVNVGQQVGALSLIGLIVLTALIGVKLLRTQGLTTLARAQQAMGQGQLPALELAEGVMLLLAGAFLLTPGFATDAVGFLLLWPAARKSVARYFVQHMAKRADYTAYRSASFTTQQTGFGEERTYSNGPFRGAKHDQGDIIDAEYSREETQERSPTENSGTLGSPDSLQRNTRRD